MPRNIVNYDALAQGMNAFLEDPFYKKVFEKPVVKKASADEQKVEEKATKHPVHEALEKLVNASSTLDAMGLNDSSAAILRVADLIVAEANGETQEVKPDEGKPESMPAGGEKPTKNEEIGEQKADKMSADDDEDKKEDDCSDADDMPPMDCGYDDDAAAGAKEQKKKEREQKALEVVEDLINRNFGPDEPSEWKDPSPGSDIEPIKAVPGE